MGIPKGVKLLWRGIGSSGRPPVVAHNSVCFRWEDTGVPPQASARLAATFHQDWGVGGLKELFSRAKELYDGVCECITNKI